MLDQPPNGVERSFVVACRKWLEVIVIKACEQDIDERQTARIECLDQYCRRVGNYLGRLEDDGGKRRFGKARINSENAEIS
mgnify:CR=1 FL=1